MIVHVKVILVLAHMQGQPRMVRSPQLLDAETVETVRARCVQGPPQHFDVMYVVHQEAEKFPARLAN